MSNIQRAWRLAKLPLAVSLASTLAAPAFAVSFNIGELEGSFDSSLSVGASWSTQKPSQHLIGANNGGSGLSQTSDDSRLNFKRGETFSKIFKGTHDLELKYGDTGMFVRGKYWYDFELKDEHRLFKDIDDSNRKTAAQASGAEILDAFVYHNYDIAEQPGSVRLGKQVVSWGESTFIMNGINAVNPVDVAAFRRPGAEIKEGLIPVNMFYVSQSLTDNLSAEAFYQLEWDQTVVDNCGTFFAQPDVVADGCDNNLAVLKSLNAAQLGRLNGSIKALNAIPGRNVGAVASTSEGVIVPRLGDEDARDGGQWGLAFRYMFEPLDTEFGAYFMNYHSRTPIFSGASPSKGALSTAGTIATGSVGGPAGWGNPTTVATAAGAGASVLAANGGYFMEYPEDLRLYGLSFSTTLPTGTAWQGEISYRPNAPVQLNTVDILYSGLSGLTMTSPRGPVKPYANASILSAGSDGLLHGYNRKEITQLQTTLTHFFDQVLGAERLTLVGEVGWTRVGGLESQDVARYGRDPVFGSGPLPGGACQTLANGIKGSASEYCEKDGFTTSDSWGYRTRAILDYNDVFAGINLKPNLSFSHDVNGYGPNGQFTEGAKAISVGVDADYLNTYTAGLSYTSFFDGKYNTMIDRDFVALSMGVNF